MSLKAQFMAKFRGVPAHVLARALSDLSCATNYRGCSKSLMSECWGRKSEADKKALRGVTLRRLAARVTEIQQ